MAEGSAASATVEARRPHGRLTNNKNDSLDISQKRSHCEKVYIEAVDKTLLSHVCGWH